jgi:hypothetical protein
MAAHGTQLEPVYPGGTLAKAAPDVLSLHSDIRHPVATP